MKVRKADIGRLCTVQFNDTGRQDGMILDNDVNPGQKLTDQRVFLFVDRYVAIVELDQIVELGSYIRPRPPLDK